jgi:hypothetical protein
MFFIIISGSTVLVRILAASHRRFRNLIRTPLDKWSVRRKGLFLHRTTQNRNTKTNTHASSGIRTHGPSKQAAKTYALDSAATGIGIRRMLQTRFLSSLLLLFWVLVMRNFEGRCQRFGETYCLHLQGWSDKAEKWRAYIGLEEGKLRKGANQKQKIGPANLWTNRSH